MINVWAIQQDRDGLGMEVQRLFVTGTEDHVGVYFRTLKAKNPRLHIIPVTVVEVTEDMIIQVDNALKDEQTARERVQDATRKLTDARQRVTALGLDKFA